MTYMQFTLEDGEWDAKIIRRVRTQRGVRRYKRPIGSIIVSSSRSASGKRALRNIRINDEDGRGMRRGRADVVSQAGDRFTVRKRGRGDAGKKKFVAYEGNDPNGNVAEGDSMEEAMVALDRYVAKRKKASKEPKGNVAKLPTDRKPKRTRSGERGGDDNVVDINPDPGGAARPRLSRRQERQHTTDNSVRTWDAEELQRPKPSGPMTGGVRSPNVPKTPPSRRPKAPETPARLVQKHRRSATIALGKIERIEQNLADGIYDTPEEAAEAREQLKKYRKAASDAIEKMLQAAESSGDASLVAKAKQGRDKLK